MQLVRGGGWGSFLQFGLPFVLVVYLGLEAGGYSVGVRNQLGIVAIWVALLGVGFGLLPKARVTSTGWVGIALLGAFSLLVGISAVTWSESTERSMIEFSRVLTLLGVFVLILLVQGRDGVERTVTGVAAGAAVIGVVALASRFEPDWFNVPVLPKEFSTERLSYPLEYWNGLAALMAIGLALLVWGAGAGRDLLTRAISAGAIPILVAVVFLTASRGGSISAAIGLVALVVLIPARVKILFGLVVPAAGTLILLRALNERTELRDGNLGPVAQSQGSEMVATTLAIVLAVCLVQAAVVWFLERDRGLLPEFRRGTTQIVGILAGVLALLLLVIAMGSGFVGDKWNEFKQPQVSGSTVDRLENLNSGARYEVWKAALDAAKSEPLTGIGPGTFEFWWAEHGNYPQFMRDAHSLYLESLAEIGPLGLLLIVAIVLGPIVLAAMLSLSEGSVSRRAPVAAAAAGMVAFAVAAAVDWAWELTVLPVAFLSLAASVVGPAASSRANRSSSRFENRAWPWFARAGFGLVGIVAIALVFIPYEGDRLVRESQAKYRDGDTLAAIDLADEALSIQPYSASASVQKAQLLLERGRTADSVSSAQEAVRNEPDNWQNWYVLSEAFYVAGEREKAVLAIRQTLELNPESMAIKNLVRQYVDTK